MPFDIVSHFPILLKETGIKKTVLLFLFIWHLVFFERPNSVRKGSEWTVFYLFLEFWSDFATYFKLIFQKGPHENFISLLSFTKIFCELPEVKACNDKSLFQLLILALASVILLRMTQARLYIQCVQIGTYLF